ncbi:MAG: cobalamin-dependent protein, partial [Candidatus Aminicenantes bacterium]|nr:cobalamin-dependent protein [Candidatus Aminicenantes bacterium]
MAKIVFIEPKSPNLHIFSLFKLPRLGIFILGSLMKKRGWDVDIFVEDIENIQWNSIKSADMIGISTITSTAPRAYMIADKAREYNLPVMMGGPHVSFLTDEALEHADFVIRGEGEEALMKFIDAWENHGDYSGIPNLSYKMNGSHFHNPGMVLCQNLDSIPFPDFSLFRGNTNIISKKRAVP